MKVIISTYFIYRKVFYDQSKLKLFKNEIIYQRSKFTLPQYYVQSDLYKTSDYSV
jgi:hypothetical protein